MNVKSHVLKYINHVWLRIRYKHVSYTITVFLYKWLYLVTRRSIVINWETFLKHIDSHEGDIVDLKCYLKTYFDTNRNKNNFYSTMILL